MNLGNQTLGVREASLKRCPTNRPIPLDVGNNARVTTLEGVQVHGHVRCA